MEGPTLQEIKILQGNETSSVAINCRITCLNNASENNVNLYNPAVTLVADRDSEKLKTIHTSDASSDLYDRIEYTELSPCVQENDESRHLYEIYPTVNTNRTVVRCAVQYRHTGQLCMGESVVVIRYINSTTDNDPTEECNSSITVIPTPTSEVCGCTTTYTSQFIPTPTSEICGCTTTYTSQTCTTTTAPTADTSERRTLGATLGTVIPIIVIAVVVLLVVVLGYKLYHRVHQVAVENVHVPVVANPSTKINS